MGFFSFLFGRSKKNNSKIDQQKDFIFLEGDEEYDFEIVGESKYQDALEDICGGRSTESADCECIVTLEFEPSNGYDPNAVAIMIAGSKVGYLARHHAAEYHEASKRHGFYKRSTQCNAMIVGGWDNGHGKRGHFGVKLDLSWPPRPE